MSLMPCRLSWPNTAVKPMTKRTLDLFLALLGLLLLWPVLILVWLAIRADDGGPLFFRQSRIGWKGRPFQILKFRTMRTTHDSAQPSITATGDPRVTPAGLWLRRTKIDELPQLWNVLKGEMSFVGPRPEVPQYVALYTEAQQAVLLLHPGITDEASIEFRDEEKLLATAQNRERFYIEHCMPQKIALNLAYAKRATVLRDLGVIIRTFCSVWIQRSST
jgi:lipopolysaccharide/colanic/teichoic acid biosynthesis glycosyltransferase